MTDKDPENLNLLPPPDGEWIKDDLDEPTKAIIDNARVTHETSMDATKPLTDIDRATIRERWSHARNTQGLTLTALSKSIAMSPGTLSQCLSGSYTGKTETIDATLRKVDRWLADRHDKGGAPKLPYYVTIGVAESIIAYVKLARETDSILVITGEPGIGKTMTLEALCQEIPGSIYMAICPGTHTVASFLRELCSLLSIPQVHHVDALWRGIVQRLKGTGRTLIVDECDLCDLRLLTAIRQLHDFTSISIVLSGQPKLTETIVKARGDQHLGATLNGRVFLMLNLEPSGAPLYSKDDIRQVFTQSKVRVVTEGLNWLGTLANIPDYGRLRLATKILHLAQVVALRSRRPRNEINVSLLETVLHHRLGSSMAASIIATIREHQARATKERSA